MNEEYQSINDLPMRTKKERQRKYQHKHLSTESIKTNLQDMINASIKNTSIIEVLKVGLLNQQASSEQKIRPKRIRSEAEEEIISKIQEKDFNFFTSKGETHHFKRNIDGVLSKLRAKYNIDNIKRDEQNQYQRVSPIFSPLKTKYSKMSKGSSQMSKRKRTTKCETLPAKGNLQLNKVLMNDLVDLRKKRTNTFLFNIPTRKIPKKTSQVEYKFQRDWQDQLLENINTLQGSNIKNKKNIKVERDKISSYLKSKFINQVITTYYKFQQIESFLFLKSIIEQMVKLNEKELKIITFFTYDVNQDGFICQEDIYYFISKLPYHSKILEDFNQIIEFLRKNKLRSNSTNLPEKLLKLRQKSLFTSLTDINTIDIKQEASKKYSFTDKLFTVVKNGQRQTPIHHQESVFKKFQINFQVFTLIFAEKLPVLIPQIIMSLTQPISLKNDPSSPRNRLRSQNISPRQSKQKEWVKRMSRTRQILNIFQNENKKLSQKIQ